MFKILPQKQKPSGTKALSTHNLLTSLNFIFAGYQTQEDLKNSLPISEIDTLKSEHILRWIESLNDKAKE